MCTHTHRKPSARADDRCNSAAMIYTEARRECARAQRNKIYSTTPHRAFTPSKTTVISLSAGGFQNSIPRPLQRTQCRNERFAPAMERKKMRGNDIYRRTKVNCTVSDYLKK